MNKSKILIFRIPEVIWNTLPNSRSLAELTQDIVGMNLRITKGQDDRHVIKRRLALSRQLEAGVLEVALNCPDVKQLEVESSELPVEVLPKSLRFLPPGEQVKAWLEQTVGYLRRIQGWPNQEVVSGLSQSDREIHEMARLLAQATKENSAVTLLHIRSA